VVQVGYLPRTPRSTDRHQNWRGLSFGGRNQLCQIKLDRFSGFKAPDGPNRYLPLTCDITLTTHCYYTPVPRELINCTSRAPTSHAIDPNLIDRPTTVTKLAVLSV